MNYYTLSLREPKVQEAVLYAGNWPLGYVGCWAMQHQQASISVHLMGDVTTVRMLSMDDMVDDFTTTLDQWFDKEVLE